MITYNDIYEALRKEKYSEQLQNLSNKFIQEVSEYLKDKKEISDNKNDFFSEDTIKTKKQFENAVSIFRELMMRRKKKILNLAFIARETGVSKRDCESMFNFENIMFEKIVKSMEETDKQINDLMVGKKEESKNMLLCFKEDVDEFLGFEGDSIGPFKKGEIANLPENISNILIEGNKAELIVED